MKKIEGYDLVNEAGEFNQLPVGAYICKILDVIDYPDKEYLEVKFDIVEGKYKNYFKTLEENTGKNLGRSFRSYKVKALPFFKAFITAVEKSNVGYTWDWNEKNLVGKFVIAVFGEEEYVDDSKQIWEIKTSVKVQEFRSGEKYRAGEIKIPEKKILITEEREKVENHNMKINGSSNLSSVEISDEDLPF